MDIQSVCDDPTRRYRVVLVGDVDGRVMRDLTGGDMRAGMMGRVIMPMLGRRNVSVAWCGMHVDYEMAGCGADVIVATVSATVGVIETIRGVAGDIPVICM